MTEATQTELSREELIRQMFELASSLGSGRAIMRNVGELWFPTWQEALDFQAFAKETGLELSLIEACSRPRSWMQESYRVFPKRT